MRNCMDFSYSNCIHLPLIIKLVTTSLHIGYWQRVWVPHSWINEETHCDLFQISSQGIEGTFPWNMLMGGCFSCRGVGCRPVPSLFTCLFPVPQEEVRQAVTPAEPVQYYFTLAQQPTAVQVQGQQQGQQTTTATTTIQPGQIIIAQPQQGQVSDEQQSGVVYVLHYAHCSERSITIQKCVSWSWPRPDSLITRVI